MVLKTVLIYLFAGLVLLGAAYFVWSQIEDKAAFDLYTNPKEGFSMKYPKGWKVIPHPEGGAIVAMAKPKDNPLVMFQDNWSFSLTPLAEPLTLDQYVEAANAQVLFLFREAKASVYPMILAGHQGRKLVYISPDANGLVLVVCVFIYKNVAYNISFMGAKGAYTDFNKRRAIDHVINSLKVNF